jgi:hypothetical protein
MPAQMGLETEVPPKPAQVEGSVVQGVKPELPVGSEMQTA